MAFSSRRVTLQELEEELHLGTMRASYPLMTSATFGTGYFLRFAAIVYVAWLVVADYRAVTGGNPGWAAILSATLPIIIGAFCGWRLLRRRFMIWRCCIYPEALVTIYWVGRVDDWILRSEAAGVRVKPGRRGSLNGIPIIAVPPQAYLRRTDGTALRLMVPRRWPELSHEIGRYQVPVRRA
jgi:hypothetical protein